MGLSIWWLIPAFVGLVGVLSLVGGLARMFKLRIFSGGLRALFGGALLAGAGVIGLIGLNLQTFSRLTYERLAAQVTLEQTGPGSYTAIVERANEDGVLAPPEEYMLTGDSFRMEADVVTFKPWANVLGSDALYRFDRIQGRFDSETAEVANPPTPWSMRQEAGIDLFRLPLGNGNPLQRVDAEFMNGAAMPMADGAIYEIQMSQRGLIPRPLNSQAEDAIARRRAGARTGDIYNASPSRPTNLNQQPD